MCDRKTNKIIGCYSAADELESQNLEWFTINAFTNEGELGYHSFKCAKEENLREFDADDRRRRQESLEVLVWSEGLLIERFGPGPKLWGLDGGSQVDDRAAPSTAGSSNHSSTTCPSELDRRIW